MDASVPNLDGRHLALILLTAVFVAIIGMLKKNTPADFLCEALAVGLPGHTRRRILSGRSRRSVFAAAWNWLVEGRMRSDA